MLTALFVISKTLLWSKLDIEMATFRPIRRAQGEDFSDCPAKRARTDPFKLTASIPKGSLRCYEYKPEECAVMDIPSLFTAVYTALIALLLTELGKQQYKCSLIVQLAFYKPYRTITDWACPYFQSKPMAILKEEDIEPFLADAHAQLDKHVDKFTNNGSGWTLESVLSLSVNIAKYAPLKGSSYIELPKYLTDKKAIISRMKTTNASSGHSFLAFTLRRKTHNESTNTCTSRNSTSLALNFPPLSAKCPRWSG